jgi:hypothetical protein
VTPIAGVGVGEIGDGETDEVEPDAVGLACGEVSVAAGEAEQPAAKPMEMTAIVPERAIREIRLGAMAW